MATWYLSPHIDWLCIFNGYPTLEPCTICQSTLTNGDLMGVANILGVWPKIYHICFVCVPRPSLYNSYHVLVLWHVYCMSDNHLTAKLCASMIFGSA